ncbi:MAG: hypothetical protein PHN84_07290 [Desulfuromonadaceae bacterium]|nr:hypothetical protein [Desulfuromonadaceae bacterium]MDD2854635.1 hypothetical protein [Desulfuromonadaceae bacterium]
MNEKLAVFESKSIRRIWHNEECYFSVVDVCGALTAEMSQERVLKYASEGDPIQGDCL